MSGRDDAGLPPTGRPGDDQLPGDSDRTIELPLGMTVDLVADPQPHNGGPAAPHGPAGAGLAPTEMHGETPTSPLPVDIDVDIDGAAPAEEGSSEGAGPLETQRPHLAMAQAAVLAEEIPDDVDASLDDELELVDGAQEIRPAEAAGASAPPPLSAFARSSQPTPMIPPPLAAPAHIPPLPPQELLQPTEAWAEPLSQRPRRKRLKPWFEEVFDEDYLRTLPFMTAEQTLREVSFIRDGLEPPADGELLDVACGYGRHAIELSQRGLKVTGIDLSLPLLIRAADESQRRGLSVNFVHADMRELTFENQFDGAYCMLSSFGYFDEETNLKVATGICRALKPGGRLLLDTINRDYIVGELPTRVWWEGDGCLVLEEVDFNYHTSRLSIRRSVVFQDGRQLEHDISIRAYSLHELGKLLRQAGFRVVDVSGSIATRGHFFGATSRNLIVVCEKAP